jgi:sec-independent protein translocase protein TatC
MTESGKTMPFLDHLEELRTALIRIGFGLVLLFLPAAYFSDWLMAELLRFGAPGMKLQFFSPFEPLMVQLKIAFFATLLAGAPLIFHQLWHFIAPGLHLQERRLVLRFTVTASVLFLIGAAVALVLVTPLMMRFALSFQSDQLAPLIGLQEFVSMTGWMMLGFGVMFEFPVATYLLVAGGIISVETLRRQRPVIVVVILVLAAILTPPDVLSQLILAIPAWIMFELSLVLAAASVRRRRREETESEVPEKPFAGGWFDCGPDDPPEPDAEYHPPALEPAPGVSRYQRPYDQLSHRRKTRFIGGSRSRKKNSR